ncbi:MAG: DUF2497 domain-containing protein [Roseitalea porphyridii]|uniref:PopZ family protein n=1 Tax=Roseitalea porphyridii TaxID=1852022 RepID=UPI0032D94B02
MGQPNPSNDQPSMDEILSSIRRIIERSDVEAARGSSPAASPQASATEARDDVEDTRSGFRGGQDEPSAHDDRPPMSRSELETFAEALDARVAAGSRERETVFDANGILTARAPDRALAGRYEGRLSEDDSRAFAEVASVLSATAGDLRSAAATPLPSEPAPEPDTAETEAEDAIARLSPLELSAAEPPAHDEPAADDRTPVPGPDLLPEPLVSQDVSRSVGMSFEALSDTLRQQAGRDLAEVTEEMLRPMLADWLDNNLPSMVERLVRAEIERIARGEPRRD